MQHKLISFIGGGNMAQAIVFGLLKQGYPAELICVCDPNQHRRDLFSAQGTQVSDDNVKAIQDAEVILLAVKPQIMADVCAPLSAVDFSNKLVISIAAGISTARLTALLPSAKNIIRVMPNTPALVSQGMAGLFATEQVPTALKQFAQDLLSAVGKICWLEQEQDMHSVTAGSGSSPAYFFLFMEAMQQALVEMDLDPQTARLLVQQSALGAAQMVIDNPQTALSALRENVTSKGGTTAAALAVFEQKNMTQTIKQAMQACVQRSQEMESLF
ncbi:pyrroline-5-carboxylate reductase [Canicola haemoglobinophilus]|uniref:Pyrroline-5-carboxylate reductase n=1 Tax=Canicola haemoglobinophilus TaxID=733 RepID=A0A1V4B294_9PAST|nr:pyrroline-5-carboxylate reductase [Canicola haemoglobinophilus]OOS01371.1 pyrroline-5-carboxylate reductase [Canicola haemoglobinophilus]STO54722.1 pyrroline-5-carboxylate reductase [Canicola haemoglobinophilus]STO59812.1 pyrroline-5-carboxylate reductase [Canicola haemoglobinophilus]STO69706.1 pyrroline-5-carboxylate reductase [Canicola haemoglobinophilus]